MANSSQLQIKSRADIEELQSPADMVFTAAATSQPVFNQNKDTVLANGTLIDEKAWDDIKIYFTRCLVPSTDQSRNSGAGAGLVDDD